MEPRGGEPATLIELEPPVHNRRHHPESRLAGLGMGWVRGAAAPLSLGRRPGATRASGGADCEVGLEVVRSLTFTDFYCSPGPAGVPTAAATTGTRRPHVRLRISQGFRRTGGRRCPCQAAGAQALTDGRAGRLVGGDLTSDDWPSDHRQQSGPSITHTSHIPNRVRVFELQTCSCWTGAIELFWSVS